MKRSIMLNALQPIAECDHIAIKWIQGEARQQAAGQVQALLGVQLTCLCFNIKGVCHSQLVIFTLCLLLLHHVPPQAAQLFLIHSKLMHWNVGMLYIMQDCTGAYTM